MGKTVKVSIYFVPCLMNFSTKKIWVLTISLDCMAIYSLCYDQTIARCCEIDADLNPRKYKGWGGERMDATPQKFIQNSEKRMLKFSVAGHSSLVEALTCQLSLHVPCTIVGFEFACTSETSCYVRRIFCQWWFCRYNDNLRKSTLLAESLRSFPGGRKIGKGKAFLFHDFSRKDQSDYASRVSKPLRQVILKQFWRKPCFDWELKRLKGKQNIDKAMSVCRSLLWPCWKGNLWMASGEWARL